MGDAVAYRSASLGTVLHRIVDERVEDGQRRFVMQGDNNGFVDFLDLGLMKAAFFGSPGPSGIAP